jgi:hypothetical protein
MAQCPSSTPRPATRWTSRPHRQQVRARSSNSRSRSALAFESSRRSIVGLEGDRVRSFEASVELSSTVALATACSLTACTACSRISRAPGRPWRRYEEDSADVRTALPGSPDAAAVSLVTLHLRSGPLPGAPPPNLRSRASSSEEVPDETFHLPHPLGVLHVRFIRTLLPWQLTATPWRCASVSPTPRPFADSTAGRVRRVRPARGDGLVGDPVGALPANAEELGDLNEPTGLRRPAKRGAPGRTK